VKIRSSSGQELPISQGSDHIASVCISLLKAQAYWRWLHYLFDEIGFECIVGNIKREKKRESTTATWLMSPAVLKRLQCRHPALTHDVRQAWQNRSQEAMKYIWLRYLNLPTEESHRTHGMVLRTMNMKLTICLFEASTHLQRTLRTASTETCSIMITRSAEWYWRRGTQTKLNKDIGVQSWGRHSHWVTGQTIW
jgi:hypothetical protein